MQSNHDIYCASFVWDHSVLFGIFLLDDNVVLCTKLKIQKSISVQTTSNNPHKNYFTAIWKNTICEGEVWQIKSTWHIIRDPPPSCLRLFFASHQTLGKLRVQQIFIHKVRLKLWGDTKVLLLYRHFSNTSGQMLGQLTKSLSNLTRRQFKYSFQ